MLPVWGATLSGLRREQSKMDLDSRSPYGERQSAKRLPQITSLFRFTLPVWGATIAGVDAEIQVFI